MLSLNTTGAGRLGRILASAFGLLAVLLVLGCPMSSSSGGTPGTDQPSFVDTHTLPSGMVGTWEFVGQYGTEKFIITPTTLEYDDGGYGFDFKGNIQYVSNFSANAGVIIIEYTTKPKYYTYDQSGNVTSGPNDPPGNFEAVYFREFNNTTIKLAYAIDQSSYTAVEADTLPNAKTKFTEGATNDFIAWGSVNPQTKTQP